MSSPTLKDGHTDNGYKGNTLSDLIQGEFFLFRFRRQEGLHWKKPLSL